MDSSLLFSMTFSISSLSSIRFYSYDASLGLFFDEKLAVIVELTLDFLLTAELVLIL